MKIELDSNITQYHRIHSYAPGIIQIDNQCFSSSVIVTPSTIIDDWPPQTFTEITSLHIEHILATKPELILLGTGKQHHSPLTNILSSVIKCNIGVEFMNTGAACRSYNILIQEGRNIAAALLMIT